ETLDGTGHDDGPTTGGARRARSRKSGGLLSLQQLRERSQLLDVPLIAALCSDTTLISHPSRTPSIDSSATPNSPPLTHSDSTSSSSTRPWDLDSSQPSSHVTNILPQPLTDTQQTKTKRRQRGLKTTRRYSLSGVYTTNQVPITHIKSKCSSKTFSGVHQHPSKSSHQTQFPKDTDDSLKA
ncbi:hypothetical protein OTU49_001748, partial [Cherax quadricarinatus]